MRLYQHKAEMLEPGDELFTYYGYKKDLPFPSDFPWYFEQKLKSDAEVRKLNQAHDTENKKEARKTKKKKTKTKSKSKK